MLVDYDRAINALHAIPPDLPREEWHKAGRAAIAAGLSVDDIVAWSAPAANFSGEQDVRASFRGITPDGGTGPGTLYKMAAEQVRRVNTNAQKQPTKHIPRKTPKRAVSEPMPGMSAAQVWSRCIPATADHPYIKSKNAEGVPLDGIGVVARGDPLHILGESMAGALVLPVSRPDGSISSLQFVTLPETASRLRMHGKTTKPNLPGSNLEGWLTVGEIVQGGLVYVCEGIGAAWACWKATSQPAVVAFGWGRVKSVVKDLRQQDSSLRLVLVPDVGKESQSVEIARTAGAEYVFMPDGWLNNSDVCDLAQSEGFDALKMLLSTAQAPAHRYKLLSGAEISELPPLNWCVRNVFPSKGVAALYGPSASGKSFLALDMAAAIAEGREWFDCQTNATPVVYVALEGEAGFRARLLAWEAHYGRNLPNGLNLILQPFQLTDTTDISDLVAVLPTGAVIFLDTLNRAAPNADENSSSDMGMILESSKQLQKHTGGLVVLIHHTGKDVTRGLRGHSSLFAALDAAVEISRHGERREWKVAKSKEGQDGEVHPFRLKVESLGTDVYGYPVTSCAVVPDSGTQEVQRTKLPQGNNQRLVFDALTPIFKDTGLLNMAGAPPMRLCIELDAAIRAAAAALPIEPARRTERAKAAINGLLLRGLLVCNEGWIWKS